MTIDIKVPLIDRIQSRDAWAKLNRILLMEISVSSPEIARELAGFMSDLNVELHKKFGILETANK
jgi:hypothetical protein